MTIEECVKQLEDIGFKEFRGDYTYPYSFVVASGPNKYVTFLMSPVTEFWKLTFGGDRFDYWENENWHLIKDDIDIPSMILLYK